MKKFKKYIFAITAVTLILAACDKIDEPYLVPIGSQGPGPGEKVRKILLEEFTGHKCVNCPEGTAQAQNLQSQYGEKLILLSIHAGGSSIPQSAPYDADYRTQTGTAIDNYFDPIGYPTGMINRTKYNGFHVLLKDDWQDAIEEIINDPPDAYITIESNYNSTDRKLISTVSTEILNDLSGTFNLCFFIVEDSITSAQKNVNEDYGPVPDILDYKHNHMLRGSVSGIWGVEIISGGISSGEIITEPFSTTLDQDWNDDNISVIAFLYDTETDNIIQAEEHHITKK